MWVLSKASLLVLAALAAVVVTRETPSPIAPAESTPLPSVFPADKLVEATVMVSATGGTGTGVCFRNGVKSYVWTDAHVVEGNLRVAAGPDGKAGVRFADVVLSQERYEGGRKAGFTAVYAKIIRYSARHDIALLEVHAGWPERSAVFADDAVTGVGTALWHVGCMRGDRGANSVSEGVLAAVGRLRSEFAPDELESPLIYDQVSMTALNGSSGGGVFRKSDGHCIGLVTEFLGPGKTYGALCITPVRRLRQFAKEVKALHALTTDVPVPANDDHPAYCDPALPEPSEP